MRKLYLRMRASDVLISAVPGASYLHACFSMVMAFRAEVASALDQFEAIFHPLSVAKKIDKQKFGKAVSISARFRLCVE